MCFTFIDHNLLTLDCYSKWLLISMYYSFYCCTSCTYVKKSSSGLMSVICTPPKIIFLFVEQSWQIKLNLILTTVTEDVQVDPICPFVSLSLHMSPIRIWQCFSFFFRPHNIRYHSHMSNVGILLEWNVILWCTAPSILVLFLVSTWCCPMLFATYHSFVSVKKRKEKQKCKKKV